MLTRLLIFAFLTTSAITLFAQRNEQEVLINSRSLSTASIRSVEAETQGGNISLEGVADADARVEVYAWGRGSDESIKQRVSDYYTVKIETDNNKLSVSAKRKKSFGRNDQVSVSFRVYVPVSVSSELNTSGGNISCRHLSGNRQWVQTSGGNIAFDDVKGDATGKTSGGNISISNCSETFDLFTSGGNIHARRSEGKLSLSTSGGNIALEELSGTIKAKTSGGNVTADRVSGSLITSSSGGNLQLGDLSCSLEASTSGGNLNIAIKKIGEHVKLRNSGGGNTHLELPGGTGMDIHATGSSVRVERTVGFTGDIREREIKGSVNGGGIPVDIDGGASRVVVTIR
ncbi:MAG: hypothetical protein JNK79_13660 [Chitinophagaceae bacterium]|nr:hypothetical protein [Chitinophagaceae bacterium]